ncbi:hypothetical protein A33O_18759 [Nitratireductor aquibiodomus RA22]|uniref:Uncharacterized protein n=1 Tax=Nitratireductor aquibiodomus RA22 TaxID=1189611 RepID=I5BT12_9HYPH|nr:hypothetical protein A33O_18759 [Nitratireductor aquibiodomus RA22]
MFCDFQEFPQAHRTYHAPALNARQSFDLVVGDDAYSYGWMFVDLCRAVQHLLTMSKPERQIVAQQSGSLAEVTR